MKFCINYARYYESFSIIIVVMFDPYGPQLCTLISAGERHRPIHGCCNLDDYRMFGIRYHLLVHVT